MRKVVQCIPFKTIAALAVLEDIVNCNWKRRRICWQRIALKTVPAVLRAILLELCAELRPVLERDTARSHALLVP